jgi:hypothetical protein
MTWILPKLIAALVALALAVFFVVRGFKAKQ